jgi:putative ABC transport system ATP-binding protein/lipoprotein-releasing system ATP-binding protein
MTVMIALQGVSKVYSVHKGVSVSAVCDVDVTVERGEFLFITGRSGSGKTTLLNLAAGLVRPSSGRVLIDGTDVWGLSDARQALLRNEKIGFVFQFPSLLPTLSIQENVALPTMFGSNQDEESVAERARKLLEMVGLGDRLSSLPRQLSAGQQQRVVIARSLINEPEILLADEPTSDLDERTETEIMELFAEVHRTTGVTVLMVTHSTQLVCYGTRAIELAKGEIKREWSGLALKQ